MSRATRGTTTHRGCLYVVQQPDGSIKLGVTTNLPTRLLALEAASGQSLQVLAIWSIRDFETHCHELCARYRKGKQEKKQPLGEWFSAEALEVLSTWLPRRKGRPFVARCSECGRWFTVKMGGGKLCSSEICKRKQARARTENNVLGKRMRTSRCDQGILLHPLRPLARTWRR